MTIPSYRMRVKVGSTAQREPVINRQVGLIEAIRRVQAGCGVNSANFIRLTDRSYCLQDTYQRLFSVLKTKTLSNNSLIPQALRSSAASKLTLTSDIIPSLFQERCDFFQKDDSTAHVVLYRPVLTFIKLPLRSSPKALVGGRSAGSIRCCHQQRLPRL